MTINPDRATLVEPSDDMFLRDLASRIVRKESLAFELSNGTFVAGFPSGVDDEWIKIVDTRGDDHPPRWINRNHIVAMTETKEQFNDRDEFSEQETKDIGYYTAPLRTKAKAAMAIGKTPEGKK